MNQKLAALSLMIFFAMAWLPLGQQEFLVNHWMKIGAFIAPILVFAGFKSRGDSSTPWMTDVTLIAYLLTASYLIHQVEEHWVDLLGREYPLYDFLNELIATLFGRDKYGILTRNGIFYINAGMVWTAGFLAILASPKHIFPALAMAGIMLVNGAAHVLNAIVAVDYNSGLATALVLFLPLSILFYRALIKSGAASIGAIAVAVLWGFVGHVILFAGLFAANVFGLVPVEIYYITLIFWGALPTLILRKPR
ncbi:MAG: HXXEE domain-containing protein [Candidatus Phaeomarinobacter sp.]